MRRESWPWPDISPLWKGKTTEKWSSKLPASQLPSLEQLLMAPSGEPPQWSLPLVRVKHMRKKGRRKKVVKKGEE